MKDFTIADIPSLAGKFAIVTGGNSGIGYDTVVELARAGAEVVLAARNEAKGAAAAAGIGAKIPGAKVGFRQLDLASLASVADFAARIADTHSALDILVNNAGVMALPRRQTTEDGFEAQFGVNHLGHFALTGRLLALLRNAPAPRTVQLSSIAHRGGQIAFADLQSTDYKRWKAYAQSKLATLIFALELRRRSEADGWKLLSTAAHPGVARTELIANGPGGNLPIRTISSLVLNVVGQSSAAGALPVLLAATSPQASPGGYYGPTGFREMKGPVGIAKIAPQAQDLNTARKLWEVSEELTGVNFAG